MAQAYDREAQNNTRLDALATKVSALRGVTIDIYDSARDQDVLDRSSESFSSFSTSLSSSATRMARMAASGNKVAVVKLAGIIVAGCVGCYWVYRIVF